MIQVFSRLLPALGALALLLAHAVPASALDIQRVVSDKGIEAWLVEEHAVPLIVMEAAWDAGSAQDPEGKEGLSVMLASLMDEGAGELDSQAYQRALAELAVQLGFNANRDTLDVKLKTLSEHRDAAFALLKKALEEPCFDEEAVARIRDQLKVAVARDLDNPGDIASRAWYEAALGGHPYARPTKGTEETLSAITRADVADAHKRLIARGNLHVAVVGDIDAETLKKLLDDTFGNLPENRDGREIADVKVNAEGRTEVIRRDIPQSVAIFGHGGIKRDDPDFIPAFIMNHILGGGSFTSRLMSEVREKRGLAYSVVSYFYPLDHTGLYVGQVATENARVAESLDIIRAEIARMAEEGVSEAELEDAKTYLTGSYPLRFDSNEKIAAQLIGLQLGGLPITYVDERNEMINAVTKEDIARVAERLLHPGELIVTVVGQPEGIEPAAASSAPAEETSAAE